MYRYVDWGIRPARGIAKEVLDLVGDAARALQAGLEEIMPHAAPRQAGVIFTEADESDSEGEKPVKKLKRWLGLPS